MFGAMLRGGLLGLAVSVPIGPVGILVVRRAVQHGAVQGLITGLGATAADLLFATLAFSGATALVAAAQPWSSTLQIGSGVVLGLAALRIVLRGAQRSTQVDDKAPTGTGVVAAFGLSFALIAANPAAIVIFAAAFSALGLSTTVDSIAAIAGLAVGSVLWWGSLATFSSRLGARLSAAAERRLELLAALALAAFGVVGIVGAGR